MIGRIQGYLREAAARGRDTERIGPFLATFSKASRNAFLNYAIPVDDGEPSPDDVRGLIAAYERRGLRPRLEYITDCAPLVEDALLAAGFAVEGRLALMTSRPGQERALPVPDGIELIKPTTEEELLALRSVQNEAYGDPEPPASADAERLGANVQAGGMAVLALVVDTGEAVGAGEYTIPIDGITEITSVAVRARFRRRGIAAAMTSWLLTHAFESGITDPFLMANEPEERIYARVGFRTTSRILHISRPASE